MFVYFINDINEQRHKQTQSLHANSCTIYDYRCFHKQIWSYSENKNSDFDDIRKSNEKQKEKRKRWKTISANLKYELRNNSFLTSKIIYSSINNLKVNENNIFLNKNLYIYMLGNIFIHFPVSNGILVDR